MPRYGKFNAITSVSFRLILISTLLTFQIFTVLSLVRKSRTNPSAIKKYSESAASNDDNDDDEEEVADDDVTDVDAILMDLTIQPPKETRAKTSGSRPIKCSPVDATCYTNSRTSPK